MTEGTFFRRLHGSALRVQVQALLAVIPIAGLLYGAVATPVVVEVAMSGASPEAREAAWGAAVLVVAATVAGGAMATFGAALLLRGSMRSVVEQLQVATSAVARGDFAHRIDTDRTDELGELARSIDTMAGRLERLEESRRRMLACVSHELRTPLTIIRGHAFTLARHETDQVRRDRLDLVQDESARLAGLIEDLVDASCLHAGSVRLRIERADLVAIVCRTVQRFEEEAAMRGIAIRVRAGERPVPVDADPVRIDQLLANLLANAVRHADADTRILVSIDARRGASHRAVIVENHGAPIPSAIAGRIFEPFVQGDEGRGRVGLGLAIAQGLAAAHGGELSLASRGEGAARIAFRLSLPVPVRSTAPVARVAASRPAVGARTSRLRLVET